MDPIRLFSVVSLLSLHTVMFGGYSLLRLLIRGGVLSPFQEQFFRAGHAHAGVLLVLSLVYFRYLADTALGPDPSAAGADPLPGRPPRAVPEDWNELSRFGRIRAQAALSREYDVQVCMGGRGEGIQPPITETCSGSGRREAATRPRPGGRPRPSIA